MTASLTALSTCMLSCLQTTQRTVIKYTEGNFRYVKCYDVLKKRVRASNFLTVNYYNLMWFFSINKT